MADWEQQSEKEIRRKEKLLKEEAKHLIEEQARKKAY